MALILALLMGSFSVRSSRSGNSSTEMTPEERQIMMEMSEELNELGDKPFAKSYLSIMSKNVKMLSTDLFRSDSRASVSLGGLGLVGLVLSLLVFNPLIVGCRRFFLQNSRGGAELSELGAGFKGDWGNVVLVMFLRNLFTFLWALLFVIPGIVKAYSYRMVPYLLRDHPELTGTQVITVSRQMMNGHKWRAFVLDLSFLGWLILSVLTAGILYIFYVGPYIHATDAELYEAVRMEYESRMGLN